MVSKFNYYKVAALLLTIAFIILKITNMIDFNWWQVFYVLIGYYSIRLIATILGIIIIVFEKRKSSLQSFDTERKSKFKDRLDAYMKDQQYK